MKATIRGASMLALGLIVATAVSASAQTLEKVKLVHGVLQLSTSYAMESSVPAYLGFWKQEGLDVEVATLQGAAVGTQLLISGSIDALIGSPQTAMIAVQRGSDLKIYYTARRGDIFGVGIPISTGLKTLADLRGKTVGVSSFASNTTLYIKSMMRTAGIDEKDIKLIEIGVGARAAAALRSNQVQAISLFDEGFAQLEQIGIKFGMILKDPAAESSFTGSIVARTEDITKRQKVLIGIARGIAKAHAFAAINPAAAVRIHWKVYPQSAPRGGVTDAEVAKMVALLSANGKVHSRDAFGTGRYGDVTLSKMEGFQKYMVAAEMLPAKIDPSKYVTNELIKEINNFDLEAIEKLARDFKGP